MIGFIKEEKSKTNAQKYINLPCDFTHILILGETGSGKTTGVINPILHERIKLEHGIILYDFKGHYHKTVKYFAKKERRLKDVVVIGPKWGENTNLLSYFNENSLNAFLHVLIKHSEQNKFWEDAAINLATGIINIIEVIGNKLQYDKSLRTLLKLASSKSEIKNLLKQSEQHLIDYMQKNIENLQTNPLITDKLFQLKKGIEQIKFVIGDNLKIETGERTTLDSIIPSLTAPLSNIATKEFLNKGEFDILDEANKGKIICIDVSSFSENEIAALNLAVFANVKKRFIIEKRPVSIFIDEAQKILNEKFELPVDILRESQIDVILATQSISNIKKAIGHIQTETLLANLTTKVYLKGIDKPELSKGEYMINDKKGKLKNLFVNNNELEEIEEEYQKKIVKIYKKLGVLLKKGQYLINSDDENYLFYYDYFTKSYGKTEIKKVDPKKIEELYKYVENIQDEKKEQPKISF
ncbi:hypothetical protein JCM15786_02760 [Nautilia lithotrophica]